MPLGRRQSRFQDGSRKSLGAVAVDGDAVAREGKQGGRLVEQDQIGITEGISTRRPLGLSSLFEFEGCRFESCGARCENHAGSLIGNEGFFGKCGVRRRLLWLALVPGVAVACDGRELSLGCSLFSRPQHVAQIAHCLDCRSQFATGLPVLSEAYTTSRKVS